MFASKTYAYINHIVKQANFERRYLLKHMKYFAKRSCSYMRKSK